MFPSRLTAVQTILIAGAATAVTAMGVQLLRQDLALEHQEVRQRLNEEIDSASVLIERALSQTAAAMRQPDFTPPSGAILIRFSSRHAQVHPPGALLFVPAHSSGGSQPAESFAAAEREEFANDNLDKAAALYRAAGTPPALVRLARVQRKQGRTPDALATYNKLLESAGYFEETPIALLAALARAELAGDSQPLTRILEHPVLPPSRDVFLFHAQRASEITAGKWRPDPARLALADAIHAAAAATKVAASSSGGLTILTHRDEERATILAMPAAHFTSRTRVHIGQQQSAAISRSPAVTGLPWPISLPEPPPQSLFGGRRRILALGTFTVPLFILLTGFLSARAIARERAATAMQTDFVAAVSHEFRTPLTALRQFTGLLLDRDNLTEAQRRTCYEAQQRSTERLSRLVESLLDFRRMEAGARPYHPETLDASALITKIAADFQGESKAEIALEAPPTHSMEADPAALTLAIWNLLDNAVKYGQPPFELKLQPAGEATRISVTDHGPGVPRQEVRRIFEKFYRGSGASSGGVKGAGIGLAMVRHIVEAHRGRVDVQSELGHKTTFTLILPN